MEQTTSSIFNADCFLKEKDTLWSKQNGQQDICFSCRGKIQNGEGRYRYRDETFCMNCVMKVHDGQGEVWESLNKLFN